MEGSPLWRSCSLHNFLCQDPFFSLSTAGQSISWWCTPCQHSSCQYILHCVRNTPQARLARCCRRILHWILVGRAVSIGSSWAQSWHEANVCHPVWPRRTVRELCIGSLRLCEIGNEKVAAALVSVGSSKCFDITCIRCRWRLIERALESAACNILSSRSIAQCLASYLVSGESKIRYGLIFVERSSNSYLKFVASLNREQQIPIRAAREKQQRGCERSKATLNAKSAITTRSFKQNKTKSPCLALKFSMDERKKRLDTRNAYVSLSGLRKARSRITTAFTSHGAVSSIKYDRSSRKWAQGFDQTRASMWRAKYHRVCFINAQGSWTGILGASTKPKLIIANTDLSYNTKEQIKTVGPQCGALQNFDCTTNLKLLVNKYAV